MISKKNKSQSRVWVNLSFEQKMLHIMPLGRRPNVVVSYEYEKQMDAVKLLEALRELVKYHDVLRCRYKRIRLTPKQSAVDISELDIKIVTSKDIENLLPEYKPTDGHGVRINALHALAEKKVFSYSKPPLFQLYSYVDMPDRTLILLAIDHIIFDASSAEFFFKDLIDLYEEGRLSSRPFQFLDYIQKQEEIAPFLKSNNFNRLNKILKRYKKTVLGILPKKIKNKSRYEDYQEGVIFKANDELNISLKELCKNNHVSPHIILIVASCLISYKRLGRDQFILSSLFSNRFTPQSRKLIGCITKVVFLSIDLSENLTSRELIQCANKEYYEGCVKNYSSLWDLFSIFLGVRNNFNSEKICISYEPDIKIFTQSIINNEESRLFFEPSTKMMVTMDMRIGYQEDGGGSLIRLMYNKYLYSRDFIHDYLTEIETVILNLHKNPECVIKDFAINIK